MRTVAVVLTLVLSPASANLPPAPSVAYRAPAVAYRAPVDGGLRVVRGFSPPASRYGAGHLGVDLAVRTGSPVRASAAGMVRFAGSVAGRGVVVIRHPDGISTEYEPVAPRVHAGMAVAAGAIIGTLNGQHPGCRWAGGCLHWGARRGADYLDPLGLLRPLGVVRLLPWDWVPGRPL